MQLGRLSRIGALVLSLSMLLFDRAGAQSVRGTVVTLGGAPVPGVMVGLLDSAARTAASVLTDAAGAFVVKASAPGTYSLRTLRIGFRSSVTAPFTLAAGQEITRELGVNQIRFLLDTVRVSGRNACRQVTDSVYATFAVWEQVRTALGSVQLTADERENVSTIVAYERALDRSARRVREQTTTVNTALVTEPWHSQKPEVLRQTGYVLDDAGEGAVYFVPGIDVLLSPEFVEDHCFRFARTTDTTRLGIAFQPNPDRKRIAEISGVMWLDRGSSELRRIEIGYVNMPRPHLDEAKAAMDFIRMKDGRWAIASWNVLMPVLLRGYSSGNEARVAEYRVVGGELALAVRGNDTLFKRPPLQLAGVVLDSLGGWAVPNARLTLAGTAWTATTDPQGQFRIADVLPGDYTLEIRTASLDSINAVSQTSVSIAKSASDLRIRVPTGQQIAASLCGASTVGAIGIVVGDIGMRGDTVLPPGVRITAEWQQAYMRAFAGVVEKGTRAKWAEGLVDSRGRFRICGVAVNTRLTLRAESDSGAAVDTVTIPPGGRMARAGLTLDPVALGAVFAGVVVADSSRTPLPEAEVLLPDINRRVTTNDKGAFRMSDVPVGEHRIEVRRNGYTLATTSVAFEPNQVRRRQFVMIPGDLDEPPTVGERDLIQSFEEHRKAGRGYFLAADELARIGNRRMADVMGHIPGAALVRGRSNSAYPGTRINSSRISGPGGRDTPCDSIAGVCARRGPAGSFQTPGVYCPDEIESRSGVECGCYAKVYVNNMLMNRGDPAPPYDVNSLQTEHLEALEYYRTASETPLRYAGGATCGVLVVWTKNVRPDPKRP